MRIVLFFIAVAAASAQQDAANRVRADAGGAQSAPEVPRSHGSDHLARPQEQPLDAAVASGPVPPVSASPGQCRDLLIFAPQSPGSPPIPAPAMTRAFDMLAGIE